MSVKERMDCPVCRPCSNPAAGRCNCTEACGANMCYHSPLAPDEYVPPAVPRFRRISGEMAGSTRI